MEQRTYMSGMSIMTNNKISSSLTPGVTKECADKNQYSSFCSSTGDVHGSRRVGRDAVNWYFISIHNGGSLCHEVTIPN